MKAAPASSSAGALLSALLFVCTSRSGPVAAADVTVSGAGSAGIGVMNGGEINVGFTPDEIKALQKASAKDSAALLMPILTRINAQIAQLVGGAQEDKIALGVAEQFLATVKDKKIPISEWSVEFAELTRSYLRFGANIKATPVTSVSIKELVNRADAQRKLGGFDAADSALAEAAELATQDAKRIQRQAIESTRQAASLDVSRANLAFTRLEHSKGALLLQNAFEERKNDVDNETISWLLNAGDAWMIEGNREAALRVYIKAHA